MSMNVSPLAENDFAARRELLAAEIARQRRELAHAYANLEKPIHYAEYGLRGFGFLRANPWIFAAVPAAFSIFSMMFSMGKKQSPKPAAPPRQITESRMKGMQQAIVTWGGHGWRLYQLYRRVRHLFP